MMIAPEPSDEQGSLALSTGPLLYARGADRERFAVSVLVVRPTAAPPPTVMVPDSGAVEPTLLAETCGARAWRYDCVLPVRKVAHYTVDGRSYPVATDLTGDLRVGFVSCNGQERGDAERPEDERDALWQRLAEEHAATPFNLLIHGGDQIYADEVVRVHPDLRRWRRLPERERVLMPCSAELAEAMRRFYFQRYVSVFQHPAIATPLAQIPSVMMWDDHDILDGWGSLSPAILESPIGRTLFGVAREMFLLFQLCASDAAPPSICPDAQLRTLTWGAQFPGFAVIAPDLRSQRRPNRVMGEETWAAFEQLLRETEGHDRRLIVSTVPALGPRLSVAESLLRWFPRAQKYEDDLRDQWQSRSHRAEWRRFLQRLEQAAARTQITILSGEIHLATRGTMKLPDGIIHQLVASGIAHPRPPQSYSFCLGFLSRFGESPLPGRPIKLHALPGRLWVYTGQRNFLVLRRVSGAWSASWELERDGRTRELVI